MTTIANRVIPAGDAEDRPPGEPSLSPDTPKPTDLPYTVELWDKTKSSVERVLAMTSNATIGYAAFYAAVREFPDKYLTLRDKHRILTRWGGPLLY
jgi:hypothetical protein